MRRRGTWGEEKDACVGGMDSGLRVGAVLVWRSGAGWQVVEGGSSLVLIAISAGGHPLIDAVQTASLLEALDLVLRVEALNG